MSRLRRQRCAFLRGTLAWLMLSVAAITSVAAQKSSANTDEARTAARMEALRVNPPALYSLLREMPKGADLHMHLSGAVYAETFLQDAAEDHLCADPEKLVLLPNVGTTKSLPPQPVCTEGAVAAASAFKNQKLYDALIDSFSMRSFVPSAGWSGHDQFFATFARFGGIAKSHQGEWVDEVVQRAASQNEQYVGVDDNAGLWRRIEAGCAAALGRAPPGDAERAACRWSPRQHCYRSRRTKRHGSGA